MGKKEKNIPKLIYYSFYFFPKSLFWETHLKDATMVSRSDVSINSTTAGIASTCADRLVFVKSVSYIAQAHLPVMIYLF